MICRACYFNEPPEKRNVNRAMRAALYNEPLEATMTKKPEFDVEMPVEDLEALARAAMLDITDVAFIVQCAERRQRGEPLLKSVAE